MYWPEEDCVSVVVFSCISEPCPPAVGNPAALELARSGTGRNCEDWYVSTALLFAKEACGVLSRRFSFQCTRFTAANHSQDLERL